MVQRPWWCQDPTCSPVSNTPNVEDADRYDLSGFCSGLLPGPRTLQRHGYQHTNDMHLCFRSALRGVVMLEVNATDMENVARVAMRALVAEAPERPINLRWFTGRAEAK
jgi:hypothetical protein